MLLFSLLPSHKGSKIVVSASLGKGAERCQSFKKLNLRDDVHEICKAFCKQILLKKTTKDYPNGVLRLICYANKWNNNK